MKTKYNETSKDKKIYKNLILSLSILIFLLLACDGSSRIVGHIYDSEDKPIENANVKFEAIEKGEPKESYQSNQQTNKDGRFDCMFLHSPYSDVRLKLTISKKGYKTYETEFRASEAQKKLEKKEEYRIVLEKE